LAEGDKRASSPGHKRSPMKAFPHMR
jgi:hypothetical protein